MKRKLTAFVMMMMVFCLFASPAPAKRVTLVGEVNDNYQIVADGQIFEVDNNAIGDDLVVNYVAQKVKVIAQVEEINGAKILMVESFQVIVDE